MQILECRRQLRRVAWDDAAAEKIRTDMEQLAQKIREIDEKRSGDRRIRPPQLAASFVTVLAFLASLVVKQPSARTGRSYCEHLEWNLWKSGSRNS
jgi:hypothetical protein